MTTSVVPANQFGVKLVRTLSQLEPRYTTYPTTDRLTDAFGYQEYLQAVDLFRARGSRTPLSLYLHIPFCDTICSYCACSEIVTRGHEKAATYLNYLKCEIAMQGRLFAGMNQLEQLHLGGGTPTYLSDAQLADLMTHLKHWFQFAPDHVGEYSIEVDPRTVSSERVKNLRMLGFNRISVGVQDFDEVVQKAVNRIQSESHTRDVIQAAHDVHFRSVSIDLMYGLPKQNVSTMAKTLDKVIKADPDRIAIYNYTHLPHLFEPQRHIDAQDLPSGASKLDMLELCIKRLTEVGYVHVGIDHFARATDDLAMAQRQGRLHRNFQGYSTHSEADMVSCGVSAISAVADTYSQNVRTLDAYYDHLNNDELPIARGIKLNTDDALRREIIQTLMCNFELAIGSIEDVYSINFVNYFSTEIEKLEMLAQEGLLTIDAERLSVTAKGRPLILNICMVFDHYLKELEQTVDWRGQPLLLRAIKPEDSQDYVTFFNALDPSDVRFRFFFTMRELQPSQLARLTQIDYSREMVIIAVRLRPNGESEMLGVASAVADPNNIQADFAVIVRSDLKGQGLGSLLMAKLIDYCRQRGVHELVGEALSNNLRLLNLATKLDFDVKRATGDETVKLVHLNLDTRGKKQKASVPTSI